MGRGAAIRPSPKPKNFRPMSDVLNTFAEVIEIRVEKDVLIAMRRGLDRLPLVALALGEDGLCDHHFALGVVR
ncbi:hypothetical protein D3C80_2132080 [compost metagenome]